MAAPVFNPSTDTLRYQDDFTKYASAHDMWLTRNDGLRFGQTDATPDPIVNEDVNHVLLLSPGRNGVSGKMVRFVYDGGIAHDESHEIWLRNMPNLPASTTHVFAYWARVNLQRPLGDEVLAIKWFMAWHPNAIGRVQWDTHDHLPYPTWPNYPSPGPPHTFFNVYDQAATVGQGIQPIGPYPDDIFNGEWHYFVHESRGNSAPGARDGVARLWIDDIKVVDVSADAAGVTPPGGFKTWCELEDVDALAADGVNFLKIMGNLTTDMTQSWSVDWTEFLWFTTPTPSVDPGGGGVLTTLTLAPSSIIENVGTASPITLSALDDLGNPMSPGAITKQTSDASIATLGTQAGSSLPVNGVSAGSAEVWVQNGGVVSNHVAVTVNPTPPPPPPTVNSVSVSVGSPSILIGVHTSATAVARDSSGTIISGRAVFWSTPQSSIISISGSGVITGLAAGTATVVATIDGVVGSTTIEVTAPAPAPPVLTTLSIAPASNSLVADATRGLTITARDQYGAAIALSTIAPKTANAAIATITVAGGVLTLHGVAAGSTTCWITADGLDSNHISVAVTAVPAVLTTLTLTPSTVALIAGATQNLTVTARDQNNSPIALGTVVPSTSDSSIATLSIAGGTVTVNAIGAGTASCWITSGGVSSNHITVTVSPATVPPALTTLGLSPSNVSIVIGSTQDLTITPRDQYNNPIALGAITTSTSNPAIATLSVSGGVVTVHAIAVGSVSCRITSDGVQSNPVTVTVLAVAPDPSVLNAIVIGPASFNVKEGGIVFGSIGAFDQHGVPMTIPSLTPASTNGSVAEISAINGSQIQISGNGHGTCHVWVTSGSLISNKVTVSVSNASGKGKSARGF